MAEVAATEEEVTWAAEDSQLQSPRMDREVPEETVAITTPEEATTIEMETTEAMEAEATRTGRGTTGTATTANSEEATVDVEAIAAVASRTVEIAVTTEDIEADTEVEEMMEVAVDSGTAPTSQARSQAASSSISNAADLTAVAEATATEVVADTAVSVASIKEVAWVDHREARLEDTDAEAEAEASEGLSGAQSTKSCI